MADPTYDLYHMIPLPCHSFFIYVARVDTGGCPIAGRLTLSKHRHPVAAVIDEQYRRGWVGWGGVVMNDKMGR
jgi:hypothetical protein